MALKTIVSAVDGSTMSLVALRYGAEIASRAKAAVRAVFVKDVKLLESGALASMPVADEIEEALDREAEEALSRARDRVGRLGIKLATKTRRGVVPLVLLEEMTGADLLTMGRWGENALWATGLLGSAVEAVVRKVNKPVLIASGAYKTPKRVVAAFDGSPLAKKALSLAEEVAKILDLSVETLTVSKGDPVAEISGEATAETMTFMGAYGHTPLRELVIGSVTEMVMRKAKGPVVLCR
jgi:nucleotide-binding universal stress UspA family protein